MKPELKSQLIESSTDEIAGLLREHIGTIDKSMQSMMAEHEGEKAFKYPVSLKLIIEPHCDQAKVSAEISYSVNHSDESVGQMVDPNQMKMTFDGGE